MHVNDRLEKVVALGALAAWVSLFCVHLIDERHDAKTGPDHEDQAVEQALTTPAEPDLHLSSGLPGTPLAPEFVSAPVVPAVYLESIVRLTSLARAFQEPPPRFIAKRFAFFSIYRL